MCQHAVLCGMAGARVGIRSALGQPLGRIRAHGGRYLAAITAGSLLLADLGEPDDSLGPAGPRRLVELPWPGAGGRGVRFNFDHPHARARQALTD